MMKPRGTFAVVPSSMVALVVLTPSMAAESTYQGLTLSEWAAQIEKPEPPHDAVRALGHFGPPAIPVLIQAMRTHPSGAVRFLTQEALAMIGRPAVPELLKVMEDGDPMARCAAVLALEKVLGQEAIPVLKRAAEPDRPAQVQVRANGALLRLTGEADVYLPPVMEFLQHPDAGVRWIAAETLDWSHKYAAGAAAALVEVARKDPVQDVKERASAALEHIDAPEAAAYVASLYVEGLNAPDPARRMAAAVKLGKAGTKLEPVLEGLRRLVSADPGILVRGYAAWALQRIIGDPERPGETYYVDQGHPQASDDHPGTERLPWKTIQKAAETLLPGDTVLIKSGVYREFVRPFHTGLSFDRMITYRAAPGADVTLTGSDPWTPDWQRTTLGDPPVTVWMAPYQRLSWDRPEDWPTPQNQARSRCEQIFVDGKLLRHVDALEEIVQQPDTFYTDDAQGRVFVHLVDGSSPAEHEVERSVRRQILAPAVRGLGYIRVQGLTMTRCANPESNGNNWGVIGHESALSVRSGHHWIIEDCSITWANAQGLDLGGEGWTSTLQQQPVVSDEMGGHQVRRCYVSHHGVAGIVGWAGGVHHVLLEDNVTNENCLKDNFYLYEAAGVKFQQAQDCIIRRHRSHGNHAFGIWLDYNCSRNRITQCTLTNNRGAGIFLEVSPGPALVDNNVVIGTRSPSGGPWADGLYSHDNNGGTWANNLIMDNEGWGVRLRFLRDREALGGPTTAHRNRVYNNFIVRNGQGAIYLHPESERATDNRSDHNLFWGQEAQMQFFLDNSGCGVRWEGTPWGQAFGRSGEESLPLTAEEWRRYRGWDEHSVVRPPETMLPALSQEIKIDPLRPLANLLDQLTALWPADAPPLDAGYGPYEPQPVTAMQARHKASL